MIPPFIHISIRQSAHTHDPEQIFREIGIAKGTTRAQCAKYKKESTTKSEFTVILVKRLIGEGEEVRRAHKVGVVPTALRSSGRFTTVGGAHACFSAGNLSRPAGAINAPNGHAVGCRVPCDIEIRCFAGILLKL